MPPISDVAQQLVASCEGKDMPAILALFADDAIMIDPHYPVAEMKGKAAIKQGLEWAFSNIEKPSFAIRHVWEDVNSGAVEVDSFHVFRGGMKVKFPQVFILETRDGLITRLQSYPPHGPGGIAGGLTSLIRLIWRLQGKIK